MGERLVAWLKSDLGVLVQLAVVRVALHTLTNGQYGFHRDELQTLDDARHLDWGFVVYPPLTPLIGRLELALFGTSLVGFRVFGAIAVSMVMVLSGLIARELGGNRHVQILAAIATGIAPVAIVEGTLLQYVSLDYLWGVTVFYLLVRLLKTQDARWWVPVGVALGLGMETRYTMGFLALGVAAAVCLTSARKFLRSGWLWAGVAASILVFLPNLIWQAQHHFISLDFLAHLHARDARQGRYNGFFREQLYACVNVVNAPLAIAGLWFYFFGDPERRYRMIGWIPVLVLSLFGIAGARSYYAMPLYPALLAAGSVALGNWWARWPTAVRRTVCGTQWLLMAASAALFVALFVPVAPIGSRIWRTAIKINGDFRDEFGWQELARAVAGVFASLPADERARTGILTGNYGEGGALNLYGPALGLPHAMSGTNSFWYRGYDPRLPQTVVLVGFDLDEGQKLFETCQVAARNDNDYGVKNEESQENPDILLCRNLKQPWPEFWNKFRRYG